MNEIDTVIIWDSLKRRLKRWRQRLEYLKSKNKYPVDLEYFNEDRMIKLLKTRRCACCHRRLIIPDNFKSQFRRNAFTIDRIIPSKGYVRGNISVLCFRCNRLKNNMNLKDCVNLLKYIGQNRPGKTLKL
jgi:hypothetical protein